MKKPNPSSFLLPWEKCEKYNIFFFERYYKKCDTFEKCEKCEKSEKEWNVKQLKNDRQKKNQNDIQ